MEGCRVHWDDGDWIPVNEPPFELDDATMKYLASVCGGKFVAGGRACCTQPLLERMAEQLAEVEPMMSICPACWNNYRDALCSLRCSPNQSDFLKVNRKYCKTLKNPDGKSTNSNLSSIPSDCSATSLTMFVSDEWKQNIFDSCKDVKYGRESIALLDVIGLGSSPDVSSFMNAFSYRWDKRTKLDIISPNSGRHIPESITPYNPPTRNCADSKPDSLCGCTNCRGACPTINPPTINTSCTIGSWSCVDMSLIVVYVILLIFLTSRYLSQRKLANSRRVVEYANDPDQSASGYVAISERDSDERPPVGLATASPLQGHAREDVDSEMSNDEEPRQIPRPGDSAEPACTSSTLWHWLLAEDSVFLAFFSIWGAFCARHAKRVLIVGFFVVITSLWRFAVRGGNLDDVYDFSLERLLDQETWRFGWIRESESVGQVFWAEAFLIDNSTRPLVASRDVPVSEQALQDAKPALTFERLRWWKQVEREMGEVRQHAYGPTWEEFCQDQPDPRSCRPASVPHMLYDVDDPGMVTEWDMDLDFCVESGSCLAGPREIINVIDPKRVLGGVLNVNESSEARASMAVWDVRHINSSRNAEIWTDVLHTFLSQVAGHEFIPVQENGTTKRLEHPLSLRRRELGVDLSFITNISWDKELLHGANPGLVVLFMPYVLAILFFASTLRRLHSGVSPITTPSVRWYKRLYTNLVGTFWQYYKSTKLGLAILFALFAYCSMVFAQGFLIRFEMLHNWGSVALSPIIVLAVMIDSALVFNTELERQLLAAQTQDKQDQPFVPENDSESEVDESSAMLRTSSTGDMGVTSEVPDHPELQRGDASETVSLSPLNISSLLGKTLGVIGPTLVLRTLLLLVALFFSVIFPVRLSESVALHAGISVIVVGIMQFTVMPAAFAFDASMASRSKESAPPDLQLHGERMTWLQSTLSPWLMRNKGQYIVLTSAVSILTIFMAGVGKLELGMDYQSMLRPTAPLRTYLDASDMFSNFGPKTWWNDYGSARRSAESQRDLCGSMPGCTTNSDRSLAESALYGTSPLFAKTDAMWIDDYLSWLHPVNKHCCRVRIDNSTQFCNQDDPDDKCQPCMQDYKPPYTWNLTSLPESDNADKYLQEFRRFIPTDECPYGYSGQRGKRFFGKFGIPTMFSTTMIPLRTHQDRRNAFHALANLKEMAKQSENPYHLPSADTPSLLLLVPETHIRAWLALILSVTAITMALILGIVLGSIRLAALVFATTACTSITLVGAMGWIGIPLNVITLVCLGVCTATAAGAATQVVRAYIYAPPEYVSHLSPPRKERAARVAYALGHGGPVVMHGPLVTCVYVALALGIAPVAVACRIAGSLWLLLGVICAFYTLLVLPVLLSMYGGHGYDRTSDKQHLVARLREQQPDPTPAL